MCYHCCDWWPINDLARALLGLDQTTPYWLHGLYLSDLLDLCYEVVKGPARKGADGPRAWMQKNCSSYENIIRAHFSAAGGELDTGCCEVDTTFTLMNRGEYNPSTKNGDKLTDSKIDAESKSPGLKGLWQSPWTADLTGAPLKIGRFPLRRATAVNPEAYDSRFFHEPPGAVLPDVPEPPGIVAEWA